ncbi:MAG TPA: PIN domain-containing protein [Micromonosporaceae bacterium]|nr:PIN domain-containing protein [Micromonosporaceae bacterium]
MQDAVLDSSVLFPNARDVLLTIAEHDFYRPLWTSAILAEVRRNVLAKRKVDPAALDRTFRLMAMAFEDAEVEGWQAHVKSMVLSDPDDRHVVAAAIAAEAQLIVTSNLRDFPSDALETHGVRAVHPDVFLLEQLDSAPDVILRMLERLGDSYRKPQLDLYGLLDRLDRVGVCGFAAEVRRLR